MHVACIDKADDLESACSSGNIDLVRRAIVAHRSGDLLKCLLLACKGGYIDIIHLLIRVLLEEGLPVSAWWLSTQDLVELWHLQQSTRNSKINFGSKQPFIVSYVAWRQQASREFRSITTISEDCIKLILKFL